MQQFVDMWRESPASITIFDGLAFLYGTTKNGENGIFKATDLYLDDPYCSTGLATLFDSSPLLVTHPKNRLSDEYRTIKHFVEFAKAVGVMWQLEICEHHATEMQKDCFAKVGKKTNTTIDQDFFINGLHWSKKGVSSYIGKLNLSVFCMIGNHALSLAIWNRMCAADPDFLIARYVPNDANRHRQKSKPSFLVDYLKQYSWIPDKAGNFHRPADIDRESLHPEFLFDDRNGWLTAIGFGKNINKRSEEYWTRNEAAKKMGFGSVEQAEELAKLVSETRITPEELRSWVSQRQRTSQPEESVQNPERRRKGVLERRSNAPTRESVTRERSIQPGARSETLEAKAYLRAKYKNTEGQLTCQCCHAEMPFKVRDDYYFEAVQCVHGLNHRYFENRLALCPTCAAMYQHARETDDAEIRQSIIEHDASDAASSVEITIRLAGHQLQLRFVGTHWFDLKTVLNG